MQEQLGEKNQKYNEMKQRFEASNDVSPHILYRFLCTVELPSPEIRTLL